MNPIILAGIMKHFYDDFDMNEFSNRLKIQKITYLLKSKGLNLGYDFGLYMYGPYCINLTNDAYQMVELIDFNEANKLVPSEPDKRKLFLEFVNKLKEDSRHEDLEWLEIASSYVFLRRNTDKDDSEIIKTIMEKRKDFNIEENRIKEIIEAIKSESYFI